MNEAIRAGAAETHAHGILIQPIHALAVVHLALLLLARHGANGRAEQDPMRRAVPGQVLVAHRLEEGQALTNEKTDVE
jgi:hypothetical protein